MKVYFDGREFLKFFSDVFYEFGLVRKGKKSEAKEPQRLITYIFYISIGIAKLFLVIPLLLLSGVIGFLCCWKIEGRL